MTALIKLATLKELGAIEYRMADENLDPNIKLHVIRRSLDNLIDTTPRLFWGIIRRCRMALDAGDNLELTAGLCLIRSLVPLTYGMIPAGVEFTSTHMVWQGLCIKRKDGIEIKGRMFPHARGDMPVSPALMSPTN